MSEYLVLVTRKITTIQHQVVKVSSGAPNYAASDATRNTDRFDWIDIQEIISPISVDHVKELA